MRMALVLVAGLALTACGDKDDSAEVEDGDDTADTGPPTLTDDIQPIFDRSCAVAGCHIGTSPGGNMLLIPERAFSELVGATSTDVPTMLRVRPTAPDESFLLHKVAGTHATVGGTGDPMPPTAGLGEEEVELIREWIETGAPR
jgi:hypothetical protein